MSLICHDRLPRARAASVPESSQPALPPQTRRPKAPPLAETTQRPGCERVALLQPLPPQTQWTYSTALWTSCEQAPPECCHDRMLAKLLAAHPLCPCRVELPASARLVSATSLRKPTPLRPPLGQLPSASAVLLAQPALTCGAGIRETDIAAVLGALLQHPNLSGTGLPPLGTCVGAPGLQQGLHGTKRGRSRCLHIAEKQTPCLGWKAMRHAVSIDADSECRS
mmetsp:Transcript_13998/g.26142  ORF Transcript_13998/g.26142 Transcript_13998/m.26142 type:complete len:224 (+) Transcript_13998:381-1052(+)